MKQKQLRKTNKA